MRNSFLVLLKSFDLITLCLSSNTDASGVGELYIDRYSAVIPLETYQEPLASPWLASLQTLKPTAGGPPVLSNVSKSSAVGDIVLIQGVWLSIFLTYFICCAKTALTVHRVVEN